MLRCLGVTLLELMAVIAIVSILALVSIPLLSNFINNYRLSGAAEELRNTFEYARSEAIKRNISVYVSFVTGDTWCYGVHTGSACDCSVANNCNLKSVTYEKAEQLSLSVTGMTSNAINFEGSHGAANASGTATFTLFGQTSLITLSIGRLGGITMCANELSGYTSC